MNLGAPVLIIDDDPTMTEVMQEILEAAGQSTAIAGNGFHGLKLAREVKPSVIVCDLVMPQMAGSDVFRTLASDPSTARIPRILMTGRTDADRSCADALLLKPFKPDHMLQLLERMASGVRPSKEPEKVKEALWHG